MEEKMESEQSYTSESSSSTESSSGSTEGEEEAWEAVRVLGHTLELPQELCEDYSVFKEFFSIRTWDTLEDDQKENLKEFLPKFPVNDEEEKEKTVKMLFNYEPFHFTTPLGQFYNNLRHGNYRPDIAKMRKFLGKARAKQQRHKIKSYYAKLLPEVLLTRERLLAAVKAAPPGFIPRLPALPPRQFKNNYTSIYTRTKQRYFEELSAIRSEVGGEESEDDNYPDGPPEQSGRRRRHIGSSQTADGNISGTLGLDSSLPDSLDCLKNVLAVHRSRRQYRENHPELNTLGVSLDDIKQRVAFVNGAKKLMFGGPKSETALNKLKRASKKDKDPSQKQKIHDAKASKRKEEPDSVENKPLLPNIKIKCEQEESDSESSSLVDPVTSPKHPKNFDEVEIKQEVEDSDLNYNDPNLECMIKQEPIDPSVSTQNAQKIVQPIPIKLEDLDGIDMMALPIEIADDSGEVVAADASADMGDESLDSDDALTETTHANFLSLVRALFPARAAHRASRQQLYSRCAAVMRSPIAALNTWYSLSDNWCSELNSALDFLAGERGPHPDDFVPYLQFMPETQMYQWIGAGRDCDAILGRLCERWVRAVSPPPPATEAPPPKYPTSWVVRAPSAAEIGEFRAQERRRFAAAAKPFTYNQYGFRSVVGPCARAPISCAGQGALLVADRPRHANFVAIVRDAVARLPNGEGTRHDVLVLLKMSQWVGSTNEQALLSAVSTALDRLHSAKRDPWVKYDQRTAVWTYLHRHRSEDDWLKTGGRGRGGKAASAATAAATAAAAAATASSTAASATDAAIKVPAAPDPAPLPAPPLTPRPAQREPSLHSPPHAMNMEVASVEEVVDNGSDTDVDVDDSTSPTTGPHLSSAQLLMQATQSTQAKQPPQTAQGKTKGKLIAVSPEKAKTILSKANKVTKQVPLVTQTANKVKSPNQPVKQVSFATQPVAQPNSATQSVKQATPQAAKQNSVAPQPAKQGTVMPQAVKQAKVSAQSVKQSNVPALTMKQSNVPGQTLKNSNVPAQMLKHSNVTVHAVKNSNVPAHSVKQSKVPAQSVKQSNVPAQSVKQSSVPAQSVKQSTLSTQPPKAASVTSASVKQTNLSQVSKQASLMAQSARQATVIAQLTKPNNPKSNVVQKQVNTVKQNAQSPKSAIKQNAASSTKQAQSVKPDVRPPAPKQESPKLVQVAKPVPPVVAAHKSPLIKQRPLQKHIETTQAPTPAPSIISQQAIPTPVIQPPIVAPVQTPNKPAVQGTRSLLIRTPTVQTTVTSAMGTPAAQMTANQRRGIVRVLSPANQSSGKSLISPRALQGATTKKRTTTQETPSVTTLAQSPSNSTTVVSSAPTAVTSALSTRTVQLAGGRTVQLAANQTVHLPGGQSVQLSSGHTLQLSSLQLPTHSVRLPSGQTVQLASPQAMQAIRNVSTATARSPNPRLLQSTSKTSVQIPISSVQLAGQTVQIAGQTVQIAGQSVQLTGHTVKLPSGQSVQVASQGVLPPQSVQLQSGQTVQLAGGNVQSQSVQLGGQTVQLGGQTVQLAGQTVQLPGGQTVQLSSGQTLQLASGQTLQIANQTQKPLRTQAPAEKTAQPIVAKLLTNAQGQMISLESAVGGSRALHVSGVRVLSPAARMTRPLLLTTGKPLHNIILQQSDGTAIRVTSSGATATSQIVLSTIGAQTVTTSTTSAPVLKLQQVNPIQQVKLPQGLKLQQAVSSASVPTTGVRSVLMDGQQLKLVGGRHVLARILRPAQQPPH